jgi:hypothetical protein
VSYHDTQIPDLLKAVASNRQADEATGDQVILNQRFRKASPSDTGENERMPGGLLGETARGTPNYLWE